MPETVFVRTSSGSIIKMDVPTAPHAAERYAQDIARGALTVVNESDVEESTSRHGGIIYVPKQAKPKSAKLVDVE